MSEPGGQPSPDLNDVLSTMAQMWVGGIVAWQRTMGRVWSGFQEGAFTEDDVPEGKPGEDVAHANGPTGLLTVAFLAHADRPDLLEHATLDDVPAQDRHHVIPPTHFGLLPLRLAAGVNEIWVRCADSLPPHQVPGTYQGRVIDTLTGQPIAVVKPRISAKPGV